MGYVNGKIILIRGDISRDRGSRQRMIYEDSGKEPITSLNLNRDASICFASTTSRTLLFNTTGRNKGSPDLILNAQKGVDLNCSCLNPFTDEYICFTDDSIEFYKETGEKHKILSDLAVPKRIFPVSKDDIVFVIEEKQTQNISVNGGSFSTLNRVIVIDTLNQVISMSIYISHAIIDIFLVNDGKNDILFMLTSEGVLYRITKKSIHEQLNILMQKEAFQFALTLSKQHNLNALEIEKIHKSFGDFLYKKGKKNDATKEYIQCLDVIETSEVISKFGIDGNPDTNNTENLADFIWSLIKKNIANSDHVTLLLVVLIKLKDEKGMDYFLQHFTRAGTFDATGNAEDLNDEEYFYSDVPVFDLYLIVTLLKNSAFNKKAYFFAKKFAKDPLTIVSILLSTLNDPSGALEYVRSLPIDDTLRALVSYSKTLLQELPNETNAILIDVFTGKYKPKEYRDDNIEPVTPDETTTSDLKKVFYSYTTFFNYMNKTVNPLLSEEHTLDAINTPTYHPPKPSIVFSSFLSKPFEFVVFLEACLDSYQRYEGFNNDKQDILTTLYDLYLNLSNTDIEERRHDWKSRARKILKQSNELVALQEAATQASTTNKQFDNSLMMLISHMNKIDPYSMLEEEDGEPMIVGNNPNELDYISLFKFMTLTDSAVNCFKFFQKYSSREPGLNRIALIFFVSSKHILKEIGGELVLKEEVLNKIIEDELMSVLEIIQVLSTTNVATFGLVQDLLINYVNKEEIEINKNRKLIESYQQELTEKNNKLKELLQTTEPIHIGIKNQKCFMCNGVLDLPIVFFKCGHIYHQRCLNEENSARDGEKLFKCPKCMVELETANNLYLAQTAIARKKGQLEILLENDGKNDRFKGITDFIGRGGLEFSQSLL